MTNRSPTRLPPTIPEDLRQALQQKAPALAVFQSLPPSHQKEYLQWIESAKKPATRASRIDQAVQKILAGGSAADKS